VRDRSAARIAVLPGVVAVVVLASAATTPAKETARVHHPSKCVTDGVAIRGTRTIFPELRTLGTRVWSDSLNWAAVAPTRPANPTSPDDPAYRWPATLARVLTSARANGIEPMLNITGFPAWSNGGRSAVWAPTRPGDYANFAAAAVKKYSQVRRWIVVSEPTNAFNLRPQGGGGRTAPRVYARLLDAAYASIHGVRKDAVVVGGNVHPNGLNNQGTTAPDTFLTYLRLPSGRRPRLDMFGINPYTERPLDLSLTHLPGRIDFDDLDWLAQRLDQIWPRRHLKILVDEFGWNTEHSAVGWLYYISRQQQAIKLRKAYALASRLPRVDTLCWYELYDAPPDGQGLNWTSGLRTWDGVKKPAWWAFRRVPSGQRRP
jgi:hypothetical protein